MRHVTGEAMLAFYGVFEFFDLLVERQQQRRDFPRCVVNRYRLSAARQTQSELFSESIQWSQSASHGPAHQQRKQRQADDQRQAVFHDQRAGDGAAVIGTLAAMRITRPA